MELFFWNLRLPPSCDICQKKPPYWTRKSTAQEMAVRLSVSRRLFFGNKIWSCSTCGDHSKKVTSLVEYFGQRISHLVCIAEKQESLERSDGNNSDHFVRRMLFRVSTLTPCIALHCMVKETHNISTPCQNSMQHDHNHLKNIAPGFANFFSCVGIKKLVRNLDRSITSSVWVCDSQSSLKTGHKKATWMVP